MSTNGTQPSDVVAVLHKCPECDGHGDLPPHGECGVCLGDQVMVAQDSPHWSDALHDRITDNGSRFTDHSGLHHTCSRCDGPGNIHDDEFATALEQLLAAAGHPDPDDVELVDVHVSGGKVDVYTESEDARLWTIRFDLAEAEGVPA